MLGAGSVSFKGMDNRYIFVRTANIMGVEESVTFWIVKGERKDGKVTRRSDYVKFDMRVEAVMDLAEMLMKVNDMVKAKVYVFKKVAEKEINLTDAYKK